MFFSIAHIIKECKPPYLLLENVKGLLNHEGGQTFKTILATLDELGYDIGWQVCNSKNFGLAQNRERVYILGHRRDQPRPEIFPLEGAYAKPPVPETKPYLKIKAGTKQGYSVVCMGDTIDTSYPNSKAKHGRVCKGIAHTIVTDVQQATMTKDKRLRRLTPLECERLQGFPDGWTKYGINGKLQEAMSDTQRYKCLGNAVSVPVVRAIAEKLLPLIDHT